MSGAPRRNIVLFSDGTGNSASSVFKTNVRRLYEALDLTDPKVREEPHQFAFYDDGVGTSSFKPLALAGGVFGLGLTRNVCDLYAYLCRAYRPGDRIYGFGFSRGAFTIRVVAGLVVNQGLVRYDGDEAALARNVAAAYRAYRQERYTGRPLAMAGRWLRDRVVRRRDRPWDHPPYSMMDNEGHPASPDPITIEMLGVWDTVDAYGLPIEELTRAVDAYVWPLTMPDADLDPRVLRACQALALDDERNTFHPRLWNEATEPPKGLDAERITQVWFAGAHADVGGGYADGGLSHVSLDWMIHQAEQRGLRFSPTIRAQQRAMTDENGPIHDSRRGLGSYYRYKPRDVAVLSDQPLVPGYKPRVLVARPRVHHSVFRRIKDGTDGHVPIGLPPHFDVVAPVSGGGYASRPGDEALSIAASERRRLDALQDDERNLVLLRQLAYYVILGGTLVLASMPLWLDSGSCSSVLCFLSPFIAGVGLLLPGFAAPWVQTVASNPQTTLALASIVVTALWWNAALKARIADAMRAAWYANVTEWRPRPPMTARGFAKPRSPGLADKVVGRLRRSRSMQGIRAAMTRRALPIGVVLAAGYLALAIGNAVLLAGWESSGLLCRDAVQGQAASAARDGHGFSLFDTRSLCHPLGRRAVVGATYQLRVVIERRAGEPSSRSWLDAAIPASPNGIEPKAAGAATAIAMNLAVPFRRHVEQPWFKLMVRIGERGADGLSPRWRLVESSPVGDVYAAEFVSARTGPVFVYVNDALPVVWPRLFYGNNTGFARIELREVALTRPSFPP